MVLVEDQINSWDNGVFEWECYCSDVIVSSLLSIHFGDSSHKLYHIYDRALNYIVTEVALQAEM